MAEVSVQNITKRFFRRTVLENISFAVSPNSVQGITGRNGSGKSTLMKILAGLMSPNSGTVEFTASGGVIKPEQLYRHIGYAAPYITLFEEFSALENLHIFAKVRGMEFQKTTANSLLESLGLPTDRKDPIRDFSSGMMQRMRLAFATYHKPEFLFLDEPSSNLDEEGFAVVRSIVEEFRKSQCVFIATNDFDDLQMCDNVFSVDGTTPVHRGQ